jgi:hypothetical protein
MNKKIEAVRTSETSAHFYATTRRHIPEDCHLQPILVAYINILYSPFSFTCCDCSDSSADFFKCVKDESLLHLLPLTSHICRDVASVTGETTSCELNVH